MVSRPNVVAPFMTSLPVLGAVFCHPSGVYHHLQSRVVGMPFVIIERNTAPNVLCPRPSCDARLSLELEVNHPAIRTNLGQWKYTPILSYIPPMDA